MRARISGWVFALSLNGFWLYLGSLDLVDRAPRTSTTGAWYALVGLACISCAWWNRATIVARLRRAPRTTRWYLLAALALGAWFLLNVVLISHTSSLSRTFAALLVLWSGPTALLALALPRAAISHVLDGLALLGLGYAVVEWGAFIHGHSTAERFSPIADLDPISAAQIPALGAVAVLAMTGSGRSAMMRPAAIAVLVGATVVPGSRGPILAVVVAALGVLALRPKRSWIVLVPALTAGLIVGFAAAKHVGSGEYISSAIPGGSGLGSSAGSGSHPVPISTLRIRREWWTAAAKDIPDDPIVGHGVAMFVDDTPEAHRMGVAGERTYPHNSPLESLYSLGILGAIPYAITILTGLFALVLLVRRTSRDRALLFAMGIWLFAFASANVSGEIGADAALWAAGAFAVGLYADTASER